MENKEPTLGSRRCRDNTGRHNSTERERERERERGRVGNIRGRLGEGRGGGVRRHKDGGSK